MDGAEVANLVSNAGTLVAVLYVLVKRPPDAGIADRWVKRLERALDSYERQARSREQRDPVHRAWDSAVLWVFSEANTLEEARERLHALGPPPRLTPDAMNWTGEERRVRQAEAVTVSRRREDDGMPVA